MRKHSRKTAWILTAFAVLFVLSSVFLPAILCGHDCTGEHCLFCMQIRSWNAVRRLLGAVMLCALLFFAAFFAAKQHSGAHAYAPLRRTLVMLKTELLN